MPPRSPVSSTANSGSSARPTLAALMPAPRLLIAMKQSAIHALASTACTIRSRWPQRR
jgi:hypothetical protein